MCLFWRLFIEKVVHEEFAAYGGDLWRLVTWRAGRRGDLVIRGLLGADREESKVQNNRKRSNKHQRKN